MLQGQDLLHMLMDMWPSFKLVFFVCCDIVYLFIFGRLMDITFFSEKHREVKFRDVFLW